MTHDKSIQQFPVETFGTAQQLGEVVLGIFQAEVQCDMAELMLVIDQQDLLLVLLYQEGGEMDGQCSRADAALRSEEGQHAAKFELHLPGKLRRLLEADQCGGKGEHANRLAQEIDAADTHGLQQQAGTR